MKQPPDATLGAESEIFVVGDLRVDIGQQRVTRSGTELLLVAIIRGAPHGLSYDDLMARVWPGLVLSPEMVNKRANLLREALGDDVSSTVCLALADCRHRAQFLIRAEHHQH